MVYKNYCSLVSNSSTCVFLDARKNVEFKTKNMFVQITSKSNLLAILLFKVWSEFIFNFVKFVLRFKDGNEKFSVGRMTNPRSFLILNRGRRTKKNCQKVTFWNYLNKHIFGLEFKMFCLHLKRRMSMSLKPKSNNS